MFSVCLSVLVVSNHNDSKNHVMSFDQATLHCNVDNLIFMAAPSWNMIYFSNLLTVKYIHFCLLTKVNLCNSQRVTQPEGFSRYVDEKEFL